MWPQQIISPLTGLFLPMSFSQFRIIKKKKSLSSICICPLPGQHLCLGACPGPLMCPGGGEWAGFPALLFSRTRHSGWARPMQLPAQSTHPGLLRCLSLARTLSSAHSLCLEFPCLPRSPSLPSICVPKCMCVRHRHA